MENALDVKSVKYVRCRNNRLEYPNLYINLYAPILITCLMKRSKSHFAILCLSLFFLLPSQTLFSNDKEKPNDRRYFVSSVPIKEREYSFIIQDSPSALFTMRQSNESFLSLYRLGVREINKIGSNKISSVSQMLLQCVFFMPLTHEEGHRSILTAEGIGSISKPYFNKNLVAYVVGVRDETLVNLRNANLPVATRMYTAGLESDYALLLRESSMLNWNEESYKVLWIEYFFRKVSLVSYYATGLFNMNIKLKEENNEFDRDIAGHDVYGAARALHNPGMDFKRYVDYSNLSPDERKFVKRVGWRSLLNIIDLTLFGHNGFRVNDKYRINFSLGYSMAPFGDFIDEHFWFYSNSLKAHLYFRQFQNHSNWYPAVGIDFKDIKIARNLSSNIGVHGWSQPKGLKFIQDKGDLGGALDVMFKYRFIPKTEGSFSGISLNLGLILKSEGFLPEEVIMDSHFGLRFGASFWLK